MESDYSIRAGRYIKQGLFFLCRYPAFSTAYIRNNIDKPGADPREVEDYKSNCTQSRRSHIFILALIYLYTLLRNSYILHIWLQAYDIKSDDRDAKNATSNLPLKHIYCIFTNCTRLGPIDANYGSELPFNSHARLVEDVGRLPLYMICNPKFDRFHYTPVTRLDALGTLTLALTICCQFILGFWVITQQTIMPSSDDIIMFISSPKVTADFYRTQIRRFMQDLASSLNNSQSYLRNKLAGSKWAFNSNSSSMTESRGQKPSLNGFRRLSSSRSLDCVPELTVQDQAVENCMPIIRTQWWRLRQARLTLRIFLLAVLFIITIGILALSFIDRRLKAKLALMKLFEREMAHLNCFVWRDTVETFSPQEAFHPNEVSIHWTMPAFLNATVLSALSGFTLALAFALYWTGMSSFAVWLAELRMLVIASLLATRFRYLREKELADSEFEDCGLLDELHGHAEDESARRLGSRMDRKCFIDTRHFYNMPNLRQQFKDTTELFNVVMVRRLSRSEANKTQACSTYRLNAKSIDRHSAERCLAEMLFPLPTSGSGSERDFLPERFDQTEFSVETLEQIYINFRLLIDYVKAISPSMRLLVPISYLINYGVVNVAILYRIRFPSLTAETNFLIVYVSILSNYLIFLVADVHANARQIHPLLWSLIAQLTYSKDLRVQHMRSLWIRQIATLELEGGLALTCAGVRITYVNIIQLIIGTATVVVLALKPHA